MKGQGFGNKMYIQNYSQMLDSCSWLDLKTDNEFFGLGALSAAIQIKHFFNFFCDMSLWSKF